MDFKREIENIHANLPNFIPRGSEAAFNIFLREINKGKNANILVYHDPDIDGLMSGTIVENYLSQLGIKSRNCINSNRAHGFRLTDEQLNSLKGGLIIAVDFSITKEEYDKILLAGVSLINIDHHEIDLPSYNTSIDYVYSKCEDAFGVILNNQYPCEPDAFRFLSGAGMVYYFIKFVSKNINVPVWADYGAMVGISLLSDIRDLESVNAYKFLNYTFNLQSDFLAYLVFLVTPEIKSGLRPLSFGKPRLCREFVDFTFSPVFNSMLRANLSQTCVKLLKGDDQTWIYMKRGDKILSYRNDQKDIIAGISKEMEESKNRLGNFTRDYSCLSVYSISKDFTPKEGYNITNYVGVACSQIKDEYKTGAIFVIDDKTNMSIRGSVRGAMDGVDYLSIFRRNNVPCAGHHNAFGILSCDVSKIDFEKINSEIEEEEQKFKGKKGDTRKVLEVNSLSVFTGGISNSSESKSSRNSQCRKICRVNEYSRDNHRIFVKYVGDKKNIKVNKISEKYTKIFIEDICVHSFDASLNIDNDFIVFGFENGNPDVYKAVLRQGFDYENSLTTVELFDIWNNLFLEKKVDLEGE